MGKDVPCFFVKLVLLLRYRSQHFHEFIRNTVRILGGVDVVSVYYIWCFWLYGFHMFYIFFVKHPYTSVWNKGKISRCCSLNWMIDRQMMIGPFEFFFVNPLCGRAVAQRLLGWKPQRWSKYYDHQWNIAHRNHCQQKAFNLIFKK